MPINAGAEYYVAERRYSDAKTTKEKILALEDMIRTIPKHKGTEKLLAEFRKRMSKLKSQKTSKATSKPILQNITPRTSEIQKEVSSSEIKKEPLSSEIQKKPQRNF